MSDEKFDIEDLYKDDQDTPDCCMKCWLSTIVLVVAVFGYVIYKSI